MSKAFSPPQWFWDLVTQEDSKLSASLRQLPREQLADFALHFFDAMNEIREASDGPIIPGVGGLSEDDTEELTAWVVCQGVTEWTNAVGASEDMLGELFGRMHAAASSVGLPHLDAAEVYEERFGVELDLNALAEERGV